MTGSNAYDRDMAQTAQQALIESESRYRTLVESSPYCIHEIDRTGRFISINKAGLEMMAVEDEGDVLGMPYVDVPGEEDKPRIKQLLESALRGEPSEFEFRAVNGRVFQSMFVPIMDGGEEPSRLMGLTLDITDRKASEQALRDSESRYRTLLSLSSEAICRVEFDEPIALNRPEKEVIDCIFDTGYVAECNDVHAHIYGFGSAQEMVGTRLREFVPEEPDIEVLCRRFSRSRFRLTEGEVQNVDHEGNVKYLGTRLIGVVKDNLLHRIWRIGHDITERKLAELDLAETNTRLRAIIATAQEFGGIVGDSAEIQEVLGRIEMVAPTDSTVLILGETGTGKELVARAIHGRSRRKDKPLINVACAALSPGIIESELLGHEKGAFTDALSTKKGRFELADGGSIFLDEIVDLPLELQTKLLRVLQEGEFERVGGSRTRKVDVRVIAATNRSLEAAVKTGRFRSDLYYRLNVFPLTLPPLRERKNDIPLLAHHFLDALSKKLGKSLFRFSDDSMQRLMQHDWPGNIRELQYVIERAAILARGTVVQIEKLVVLGTRQEEPAQPQKLADVERAHILSTLQQTNWVIEGPNGAAKSLGLHPNTLRHRLQKLDIKRPRRAVGGRERDG